MKLIITNEGDTWTGVAEGRLDTVSSAQFENDMQPLLDNADKKVGLDCTNLEYISSSGLRLLLVLLKACKAKGGKMVIKHINNELKSVFTITGFFNLFTIEE